MRRPEYRRPLRVGVEAMRTANSTRVRMRMRAVQRAILWSTCTLTQPSPFRRRVLESSWFIATGQNFSTAIGRLM